MKYTGKTLILRSAQGFDGLISGSPEDGQALGINEPGYRERHPAVY
jgi:hypothetical protein